jgi:hypothetical protein
VLTGDVLVDPDTGEGTIVAGGTSNVPARFRPTVVARLGANHGKGKGYSETDLEGGDVRLGGGVSAKVDFDLDGGDDAAVTTEADGYLKVDGLAITAATYVLVPTPRDDAPGHVVTGSHAQVGYLIDGTVEPAVRITVIDEPTGGADDLFAVTAGLGIFRRGHDLKWQTDVTVDAGLSVLARSQVQVAF